MKHTLTLLFVIVVFVISSAQDNPGNFEFRAIDGPNCNQLTVQGRAINTVLPDHTNDDCQGIPGNGNTINYDLTFTIMWTNVAITNATDVLVLDCVNGGTGYNVRDVGGTGTIDLGGGIRGKGFSNGAFTPMDFPASWPLNVWNDIVVINLVGLACLDEGGSDEEILSTNAEIVPFGMFTQEEDPDIAMNLPDEGVITYYTPSIVDAPLPLNLLSFDAKKDGERSALVTWSTSDEVNTSHFVIERSIDRVTWTEVAKVQAAGESTQVEQYHFLDQNVYDTRRPFARFYYRLNMTDKDGRSKPSGIKVVLFDSDPGVTKIYVFPNPATDGVNVEFNHYAKGVTEAAEILMYNDLGQLVYHQDVPGNSAMEFIDFRYSDINSGTYTLQVMDTANGILATEKIVVQR